jgi:predicted alpha/beta-hydrolase family hydrolase
MKFETDAGDVSGAWHHPSEGSTYLVLAHGAGGTMDTPSMVAYADAIAARGLGAVRFNFVYSETGKKSPDRTAVLESCVRGVADAVAERADRILLGGRSMGGRIGSHLIAQGYPAAGLVFLAYPLHPPGKPENLRDAHLYQITAPMLFLQGTKDPFSKPDLLQRTIERLPSATLHPIEGADHSHKVRGRAAVDVVTELVDATIEWYRARVA